MVSKLSKYTFRLPETLHKLYSLYVAPSSAPVAVAASMVNSSGFTLTWSDPPPEDHNGIIRQYAIHITELNTGLEYTLTSVEIQTSVYFLHPFYNYTIAVSAVTNQPGPFSIPLNVRTSEHSKILKQ